MDMGSLGTALVLGISALGSAIGISIAGQASIGAWKKCYMSNKAAPFILTVFAGAPLTQTIYGFLLMQQMKASSADPAFLLGLGIAYGVAIALSAVGQGKAAALLSIEGAELLDCDIRRLDTAYDWGVRLLNPVWNYANRLSGSNAQQPEQGLTAYGRDFLQRMEELSIYVDVSHLSDAGFWDVVRLSRRPVVASHSNSRAVCPHRRNLTDDMFRAIRDSGGVAGLNYYQHFVGDDPTMEGLVRHVEHFLELDGERSLCLGGDMDGCELLAGGMRGLEDVPLLWQALADRGYPQSLLEDLFWNNLRRLI